MIIFGAAERGRKTLESLRVAGIPVECFADDRLKGPIAGLEVLHTSELKSRYPDAKFYLTSPNAQDMIFRLQDLGYTKWVIGAKQIRTVDLVITERCSMKCRDCCNLMQYYEKPKNADLADLFRMIDDFCALVDEAYEFRVIGGEPFMNKDINFVVDKLAQESKVHRVVIFTNGTIIPRNWRSLQHPKVTLSITDYGGSELPDAAGENGVKFSVEPPLNWTDCGKIGDHNRSLNEQKAIFRACCGKNLATLLHGNLYRCPFSAHLINLRIVGSKRPFIDDYLVVSKATKEQVQTFLHEKTYLYACDYCNGRPYGAKIIEPAIQLKNGEKVGA